MANFNDQINDLPKRPTDQLRMMLHLAEEKMKMMPEGPERAQYETWTTAIRAELAKR